MIDRDIDLTEDFVFIEQEKINNKIKKSSYVFEETVSYFSKHLSDNSDFDYISNFVENLIVTTSLYTFDDYLKYINELCNKKLINTYQHYMLLSEASECDVFCEDCGVYLKNNQLGQSIRQYGLCIDCSK